MIDHGFLISLCMDTLSEYWEYQLVSSSQHLSPHCKMLHEPRYVESRVLADGCYFRKTVCEDIQQAGRFWCDNLWIRDEWSELSF